MKRLFILIFLLVAILLFSSCFRGNRTGSEILYGVWESEEPPMILYIDPNYTSPICPNFYLGIFIENGEEKKVFAHFNSLSGFTSTLTWVQIFPVSAFTFGMMPTDWYFSTRYNFIGNQLRLTDILSYASDIPVEIIFNRLEEYDPINPDDWFPRPVLSEDAYEED
jgi:hypothetical protein